MKRTFTATLIALCVILLFSTAYGESTVTSPSPPFYVGGICDTLYQKDVQDTGKFVSRNLTQDIDEIEYIINTEAVHVMYDDGQRVLILGDSMMYLATRDGDKAYIQAAIKTPDDFLIRGSLMGKGIERSMPFGNGIMFTTTSGDYKYSLYYLDWGTLSIRQITTMLHLYPSFDGQYWICMHNDYAYVVDFANSRLFIGSFNRYSYVTRVTEQGTVLYDNNGAYGYLNFSDMSIYDIDAEGDIVFCGDDYYIVNAPYALNIVTAEGSSRWIKKVDDEVLKDTEVSFKTIGNLLYYSYRWGAKFWYMTDTIAGEWTSQSSEGLGTYASAERRFMAIDLSSSSFSDWHIMQLGSNQHIASSRANCTLMAQGWYFTETAKGYLCTREYDMWSGRDDSFRQLRNRGYLDYDFSTNSSQNIKVFISEQSDLSSFSN